MPSEAHEEAIQIVRQAQELEFGDNANFYTGCSFWKGVVPDLIAELNGNKYVVSEIGQTSAEKIQSYSKRKNIIEIRWYTKTSKLVGQWRKREANYPILSMRGVIAELKKDRYFLHWKVSKLYDDINRYGIEKQNILKDLGILRGTYVKNVSFLTVRCCRCAQELSLTEGHYFFKRTPEWGTDYDYKVICKHCVEQEHEEIRRLATGRLPSIPGMEVNIQAKGELTHG